MQAAQATSVRDMIERLGLRRHECGGWFAEGARIRGSGGRPTLTVIYFLLEKGQLLPRHRIDAVEIWHHYAGAPLELVITEDGRKTERLLLGIDLTVGERPQIVLQAYCWQQARSLGDWSLVGCTVTPGYMPQTIRPLSAPAPVAV